MASSAPPTPAELNPYFNKVIHFDIACIAIVTVLLALRFYVRRFMVRNVRLDDWLLLAGTTLFIIDTSLDAAGWISLQQQGSGNETAQVELLDGIAIFLYLISEILVRSAYAVFYLRALPATLDLSWHRYTIIGVFSVYATFQAANAFLYLFQCGDPTNLGNPAATCIHPGAMAVLFDASYYFDAVLDWLMALMPAIVVYKSTMNVRTKCSVGFILLLGCCASGVSVAVIYLSHMQGVNENAYSGLNNAIRIDMLATSELMVAIVCLSLAALRPLFRAWLDTTRTEASLPSEQTMCSAIGRKEKKSGMAVVVEVSEQEC